MDNFDTPIYYLYKKALSDTQINKVFSMFDNKEIIKGTFGKGIVDESFRKTDVQWSSEQYLYDLFWPYMVDANNQCWNLEVSAAEPFQLGTYTKGGHYDYHIDGNMIDVSKSTSPLLNNKTRKLSMVCWLNEDFQGGEFKIPEANNYSIIKPTKGTIVFFPSFYAHKVEKVTTGTRYSLVTWFVGDRIR